MNNNTPTNTSNRRSPRLSNVDLTATNSDNTQAREVAVLIDSFTSTDLHRNGFSCAGCGGYSDSYIVGTINPANRLMVWCVECFVGTNDGKGFIFDSLTSKTHAPEHVVDDILQTVSNVSVQSTDTMVKLQREMKKVVGCKDGCRECTTINSLLSNVWMTEIDSWYGEDDDITAPLESFSYSWYGEDDDTIPLEEDH